MEKFTILAGTGNPALADAVAVELGTPLGGCEVERFPDGARVFYRLSSDLPARRLALDLLLRGHI